MSDPVAVALDHWKVLMALVTMLPLIPDRLLGWTGQDDS